MPAQRDQTVAEQAATLVLPRPMQVLRAHRWQADGSAVALRRIRRVASSLAIDVSDYLTVLELAEDHGLAGGIPAAPGPAVGVRHRPRRLAALGPAERRAPRPAPIASRSAPIRGSPTAWR